MADFISFISKKRKYLLLLFFALFSVTIALQNIITADLYKEHEERFAYQQAKILSTYIFEFRHYYQGLFLDDVIKLDKDTLVALPAFALVHINDMFSDKNPFKISVKTVSDNARNPENVADAFERLSMERFRKDLSLKEIFEKEEDGENRFYRYVSPMFIQKQCFACHSTKERAPDFIASKYETGYGYELGDLRGVLSVKIPKENIGEFFFVQKITSFIFNVAVFVLFAILLFGAYRMLGSYSRTLEEEVKEKTLQLRKKINDLNTYKQTLDDSSIVSITDSNGIIKYVNDSFVKISGYAREELIGKSHRVIRHPETSDETIKNIWQTIKSKKIWKGVLKNLKKDGGYYVADITIEPILDANGKIVEYIAARHDITEIYDKQLEIERLALYDTLTGVGNRTKLIQDLKKSQNIFMAIYDINRFSEINDFFGHEAGDFVLKEVAKTIMHLVQERGEVYRYSGDRFALLSECLDEEAFLLRALNIQAEIKQSHFLYEDKNIPVQTSVALSFEGKSNIIKSVDIALNELKKRKSEFLIYSKSLGLEEEIEKNLEWSTKLKIALQEDRVVPFFQPILNNQTRRIEKYEALVRLIESDGSIVSPAMFLGVAKKTKQYLEITKKVIEKSFETFKDNNFEFSINLTMEDIMSEEIIELLERKVNDNEMNRVIFEIVESEGIEDIQKVSNFIKKSKECGCKIAIDDFGTGYSNFEYLIKMSPDCIKIDGSMIKDIDIDIDKEEIVKTIIDFAKKRGLKTIAEFVSSKEIFDKVVELGIDYSQGYYIGIPKESFD